MNAMVYYEHVAASSRNRRTLARIALNQLADGEGAVLWPVSACELAGLSDANCAVALAFIANQASYKSAGFTPDEYRALEKFASA